MYAADTIAAIATPPGAGGIGIVRISGPLARVIAGRVFVPSAATDRGWDSHRLYHGTVRDAAGEPLDTALAVVMRGPRSYTGEDVLELHCHGSPVALRRVLHAVLSCGARAAEPGEFTRRAFLNGRLDLTQAEAVIELIRSRSAAGAALASTQLLGSLSDEFTNIRTDLIDVRARLEVQIDFSEEEVAVDPGALAGDIERALLRCERLLASYRRGRLVRDGLRVAIAGKPNVGKSSLLNALLGEERAIVTDVPGTTRDVVEEAADFDGIPVVLSDTAGVREATDAVEAIGVDRARAAIAGADVVIAVFDGSCQLDVADAAVIQAVRGGRTIVAINKADLAFAYEEGELVSRFPSAPRAVRISALTGAGLDGLRAAVVGSVADEGDGFGGGPTVTLVRHRDGLEKAAKSLRLALAGVRQGVSPDLIAVDVQDAADHLASITGALTSEDVLDRIFSEFCIGK
jgi:tRNA modification GTPase